jgi:hypothetical protein
LRSPSSRKSRVLAKESDDAVGTSYGSYPGLSTLQE